MAPATDKPSGGAKALYDHVAILNEHNFNAFIVHNKDGYRYNWSNHPDIPVIYPEHSLKLFDDDIVVISEENLRFLKQTADIKAHKIVFCQNHFYIFKSLNAAEYRYFHNSDNHIASSRQIRLFYEQMLGISNVPVVPYSIPHDTFYPGIKQPIISYMPRKRQFEADFIKNLFQLRYPQFANFLWKPIDMLDQASTAKILRESAIFLALNRFEGFGLPPLEACACGCLVVGFHGWGGLDYAKESNGFWCDDENLLQCVEKLALAADLLTTESPTASNVIANARATALEYTKKRQAKALLNFFNNLKS